jgi:hypothetical protein
MLPHGCAILSDFQNKEIPAYTTYGDETGSVPKRRNTKFRHREITQKKENNTQNTAKV